MPIKAFKTGKQYSTEPQLDDVAPVIDKPKARAVVDGVLSASPLDRVKQYRKKSKRPPKDPIAAAWASSTPPIKEGALVRHVAEATAAEVVCALGNTGEVVIVADQGSALCRQRLYTYLTERRDWQTLRKQIVSLDPRVLSRKDPTAIEQVTPVAAMALAEVRAEDANRELLRDADLSGHSSQEPHVPAAVASAFKELKYNARERVRLILDIAYDAEQSGSDRLAAIELLDKTVLRCHKLLAEDAGRGDWKKLLERSLIEGIASGDKHAMEIAIASGKVEGYKLPEKAGTGQTAVQVNVQQAQSDPFANLSPEKRSRLAEMDRLILGGALPHVIDLAPTEIPTKESANETAE